MNATADHAPLATSHALADADPRPRFARDALLSFVGALAPLFAIGFAIAATKLEHLGTTLSFTLPMALAALVSLVAAVAGIRAARRLGAIPLARRPRGRTLAVFAIPLGLLFSGFGALLAWISTIQFSRGRQLRRFGRVLLPTVAPGDDWAIAEAPLAVDDELRHALAAQWRENGRTEHASVAAFARLSLDLIGLGAPPSLLAAANRDALDEIRHAELCFALARDLDGMAASPAPFPAAATARTLPSLRRLALAQLAVDSLVDGALHEGVSARVIARLAKRCIEPRLRAALREIAADEGRHAAHGWEVVAWCVSEGGADVIDALRGAIGALPETLRSPLPAGAAAGGWERFGIHGHALEATEFAKARADLVARVAALAPEAARLAA